MDRTTLRRLWRNKRFIAATAGALLVVLGICWFIAAADRVCLVVDGQATLIKTRAPRVEDLLNRTGVVLNPGDKVEPGSDSVIREGMTIRVHRAFPVDLIVGGEERTVRTVARSVRDLLAACGVTLGAQDRVEPGLNQEIRSGQTIRVVRVETTEMTYTEKVPPPVVTRKDGNLDRGKQKVIQEGQPGLAERRALVRLEDGRITERKILATRWLSWPVTRIIALGTRPIVYSFVTSRGQTVRYTEMMEMTATAYYPGPESCGVNAKGITRTGARATYGVVAVDPRVIRLGTRLYVEGYGFATALDTGSAIKGKKIDLCFDTYREAVMYGKRKIKVYILAN